MRRWIAMSSVVAVLAVVGCRTTKEQSPMPPDSPTAGQEPIQTVPAEPPGPAEPLPTNTDGGSAVE